MKQRLGECSFIWMIYIPRTGGRVGRSSGGGRGFRLSSNADWLLFKVPCMA